MKAQLEELLSKISSGCMLPEDVARIAEEAAQAYAEPLGFLAANPDINYDDSFPIPLGEWIVVGSLPDTVLFQADSYEQLFQQITDSFGPQVSFVLKPKQLAKTEPLKALNRIQVQLSSLSPETGGYTLLDFSEPLDDELQAVLVYSSDLARVMELAVEVGIYAAPAYESLKAAQSEG
jgi:predicted RecB family endonuclease